MPLSQDSLISSIEPIFARHDKDISKISRDLSHAYLSYAQFALGPNGDPIILKGTETIVLQQQLYGLMAGKLPAPLAAQAIITGLLSFWLLPPVFTVVGGVVTTVIPAIALAKMITTHESAISGAARSMAAAFHSFTTTIFVTATPPLLSGLLI